MGGEAEEFPEFTRRAKEMWEGDFAPVALSAAGGGGAVPEFETVWKFAKTVTDAIEFKTLNYVSPDTLDYTSPRSGTLSSAEIASPGA